MDRIVVVGTSGSGKSTLSRQIGERLGHRVIELDALNWLPEWQERDYEEFRTMVDESTSGDRWVLDGNYSRVQDIVWPRAQVIVWLDFSKVRVMSRIIRRTVRRAVTRQRLWNGNREAFSNLFSRDPLKNMIMWSWTTHDRRRQAFLGMMEDPRWSHIEFHRITRPSRVDELLDTLSS